MAAKRELIRPDGVAPSPILNPAVRVGDLIWTAGHVGRDAATGTMPDDVAGQARVTLENLKRVLEASGSSLEHVVKVNIYLADIADRPAVNKVYVEFFPTNPPGRTCVGNAGFDAGTLIEIEAVAVAKS